MKALILENQVVDVVATEFEVHASMTWMDCSDDCKAGEWELVDGNLQKKPEPDGLTMAGLREIRNVKLAQSDWRAVSDLEMSDAWKTYRQALRDLPANTVDPANTTWPDKPA